MKIVNIVVIMSALLLNASMTVIHLFVDEYSLVLMYYSMEILANIIIITLYVSSIRKFKKIIREFEDKIPKERAMIMYCYLLGFNILLKVAVLIYLSIDLTRNSVLEYSFLAYFSYSHLILLYIMYKFLSEQRTL